MKTLVIDLIGRLSGDVIGRSYSISRPAYEMAPGFKPFTVEKQ